MHTVFTVHIACRSSWAPPLTRSMRLETVSAEVDQISITPASCAISHGHVNRTCAQVQQGWGGGRGPTVVEIAGGVQDGWIGQVLVGGICWWQVLAIGVTYHWQMGQIWL